jgi:hypothetical protein
MDAIVEAQESRISKSLGDKRFRTLLAAVEDLCGAERQDS